MVIRVLIADDNMLFRQGMASLLGQRPDVQVIGEAGDGAEVVRKAVVLRPDVILMDLRMPKGGGVEATRRILAERPCQVICMLTTSEQDDDLFAAVRAGARGYLLKSMALDDLYTGLQVLAGGGALVAPAMAVRLLGEYRKLTAHLRAGPSDLEKLSAREREVLTLIAAGHSNREIADRLTITENTVKVHMRNIQDKLHLRNRQQAAAFAVQEGMSSVPTADDERW